MSSDLTPGLEAFLAAQAHRKSFTDMCQPAPPDSVVRSPEFQPVPGGKA